MPFNMTDEEYADRVRRERERRAKQRVWNIATGLILAAVLLYEVAQNLAANSG